MRWVGTSSTRLLHWGGRRRGVLVTSLAGSTPATTIEESPAHATVSTHPSASSRSPGYATVKAVASPSPAATCTPPFAA